MRKFFFPILSISLLVLLLSSLSTIGDLHSKLDKQDKKINSLQVKVIDTKKILKKTENQLIFKQGEMARKKEEITNYKTQLDNLLKQNNDLKKKVEYYKNRSESPSASVTPSRGESGKRKVIVEATAYTASCYGCSGRTASGDNVKHTTKVDGMRVIATDPNVIPMYSLVKVETRGETFYAQALDKGGAIKGHKVDVLVSNTSVAKQFGRQTVTITVLRKGKGS